MEAIELEKDKPTLRASPPQDLPVDLTIKNALPSQDLLNHLIPKMSNDIYPHLRFHKSVIEETDILKGKQRETQLNSNNREESSILTPERKSSSHLSKKRRLEDESEYYASVKKLRSEHFQPSTPTPVSQQYFQKPSEHMKHYLSNVRSNGGQTFDPSQTFEHESILDRMQSHPVRGSPESIKETEALMAAVQHSQMLYYSYCTQLLQSLQAQRVLNEQEHRVKLTSLNYTTRGKTERSTERTFDNQRKVVPQKEVPKNHEHSPTSNGPTTSLKIASTTPSSSPTSSLDYSQSPTGLTSGNEREDKVTSTAERKLPGRKRVPRVLTGKHVRPGTGASLTTLLSLRQKLNQRQKMRQEENNSDQNVENFIRTDSSPCWRRR